MMQPSLGLSEFTTSAVVVYIINTIKSTGWFMKLKSWLPQAERVASALLAALSTAGLQWQWTPETHTLVIANLTLAVVGLGVWHWVQHYVLQETIFRATKPAAAGASSGTSLGSVPHVAAALKP
jgi:hypothetical protein